MKDGIHLPFKAGQLAESRSFLKGYRGAWFKCKIKSISRKNRRLGHVLEYPDFPAEKLKWEMLYQVASHQEGDTKGKHRELMLRPPYPPVYNEKKIPHVSEISEVAVIVGDSWRVGDLVDWWTTNCYWSGTITQLLGPNKAQIELTPPPLGEGGSYEALFKDLRPSLDWSPELGWTVPTQESASRSCARLIKPINQDCGDECVQKFSGSLFPSPAPSDPAVRDEAKSRTTETQAQTVSEKRKEKSERHGSQRSVDGNTRKTSLVVADSGQDRAGAKSRTTELQIQTVPQKQDKQETNAGLGPVDSSSRKTSQEVADSGQNVVKVKSRTTKRQMQQTQYMGKTVAMKRKDRKERSSSQGSVDSCPRKTSRVVANSWQNGAEPAAEEERNPDFHQKKYKAILNSKHSDTLEAVILDLEEYVNKVKWLKKILQYGIVSSDDEGPQWAFMEPLAAIETTK